MVEAFPKASELLVCQAWVAGAIINTKTILSVPVPPTNTLLAHKRMRKLIAFLLFQTLIWTIFLLPNVSRYELDARLETHRPTKLTPPWVIQLQMREDVIPSLSFWLIKRLLAC